MTISRIVDQVHDEVSFPVTLQLAAVNAQGFHINLRLSYVESEPKFLARYSADQQWVRGIKHLKRRNFPSVAEQPDGPMHNLGNLLSFANAPHERANGLLFWF